MGRIDLNMQNINTRDSSLMKRVFEVFPREGSQGIGREFKWRNLLRKSIWKTNKVMGE
jgi:hypothetical protein